MLRRLHRDKIVRGTLLGGYDEMVIDVVPLENRLRKANRRKIGFSSFCPEIVSSGREHDETYFWLGREIDQIDLDYSRLKVIEKYGPYIVENLIMLDTLRPLTNEEPLPAILIGQRVFDQSGQVAHHYLTSGLMNGIYNHVGNVWFDTDCYSVVGAETAEWEAIRSICWNHLPRYWTDEEQKTPNTLYTNDHLIPADDESAVEALFKFSRPQFHIPKFERWQNPKGVENFVLRAFMSGCDSTEGFMPYLHLGTRPYSKLPMKELFPISREVRTNVRETETGALYALFKYIEGLPYTEYHFVCSQTSWSGSFWNAYTANQNILRIQFDPTKGNDLSSDASYLLGLKFADMVRWAAHYIRGYAEIQQVEVYRSYNDDAYITYRFKDGTTEKFYVDFMILALASRGLLEEYEASWFLQFHAHPYA